MSVGWMLMVVEKMMLDDERSTRAGKAIGSNVGENGSSREGAQRNTDVAIHRKQDTNRANSMTSRSGSHTKSRCQGEAALEIRTPVGACTSTSNASGGAVEAKYGRPRVA